MADSGTDDETPSATPRALTGASERAARERRLAALHALAQQQAATAPTPSATPSPPRQRQRAADPARRGWLIAGAVGLVAVVVVAGILLRPRAAAPAHHRQSAPPTLAPPTLADPLVLSFGGPPFKCPAHAAWSPDNAHVAVAGFANCDANAYPADSGPLVGSALALYDATTGALLRTTALDVPLLAQVVPPDVRADPAQARQIVLVLDQVVWSPDGQTIALPFNVLRPGQPTGLLDSLPSFGRGLLLVSVAGAVRILPLSTDTGTGQQPYTSFAPLPAVRWDLTAGTATAIQVPQALAYSWSGGDALTPTQPLPATPDATAPTVSPAGPVGNPLGGATFTVWQTGLLGYTLVSAPGGAGNQFCVATDFYGATFGAPAVWSPDGRYLLLSSDESAPIAVGALGRVPAPAAAAGGVAEACTSPPATPQWAHLPVRDALLSAALPLAAPYPVPSLQVVWSPGGQRLASLGNGSPPILTVFGGPAGHTVLQLDINHFEPGNFTTNNPAFDAPRWASDSRHLLLTDFGDQHVSILGPQSLRA